MHTIGLNKLHDVLGLNLTCIDCLDHRAEGTLAHLFKGDVSLLSLKDLLLVLVMELLQVHLLEKLKLLQNGKHIVFT